MKKMLKSWLYSTGSYWYFLIFRRAFLDEKTIFSGEFPLKGECSTSTSMPMLQMWARIRSMSSDHFLWLPAEAVPIGCMEHPFQQHPGCVGYVHPLKTASSSSFLFGASFEITLAAFFEFVSSSYLHSEGTCRTRNECHHRRVNAPWRQLNHPTRCLALARTQNLSGRLLHRLHLGSSEVHRTERVVLLCTVC